MSVHRRRLIAAAGACTALASTILPLVGARAALAAPPATAYSGDAYGIGILGTKVLNGAVTLSDLKIPEMGPFNGPTPQSGDTGLITVNANIGPATGGLHVAAQVARETVTEGNSASTASSHIVGAAVSSGLTGLVTAGVADVTASASCSGPPSATFNLVNLRVAGIAVNVNPNPNTTVTVTLLGRTVATVTLNKQTLTTAGNHSQATASAVEVNFPANGALRAVIQGTIVISHAEANVDCTATQGPVFTGYADTVRPPAFTPTPWYGSMNTNFVGSPPPYDTGGVRVDNPTPTTETATVTVDIGGAHYDLWGPQPIPANGSLVLASTTFDNFDTSEAFTDCAHPSPLIPVIHVSINGGPVVDHLDTARVLTNGGVDRALCNGNVNEGTQWTPTT